MTEKYFEVMMDVLVLVVVIVVEISDMSIDIFGFPFLDFVGRCAVEN